ncbi:MAG: DUF58 domain-containing protein, partial [Bacteroidetes bacterium]|nr:DUF58 domain-containing protein [Bacteroidota bacterium]
EIPFQFQVRDFEHEVKIASGGLHLANYMLKPVKRGEYSFGSLNVFISSPVGLVKRRFNFCKDTMVPVYPSFIQMNKYELFASISRLKDNGIKQVRRIGHSLEFEKIREYVNGDDQRAINWKATGRSSQLMVNQFQDEKSQPVYCIIDKGRAMQMPFNGMSLLDYAINTSLVISNIALNKQDKAGLITFSDKMGSSVKADRKRSQIRLILEVLYNQKTHYLETDFRMLYGNIQRKLNQRSLLILFSNFGSLNALRRQMPYLKAIAKSHLLVVVFFENTELSQVVENPVAGLEQVYFKTIAEQFVLEKKQMAKELEASGIHSILSSPENLTVKSINKYLELKSRRLI